MNDAGSSAQRIRIGLTGLAFAFLIVLLGTAIKPESDQEESAAATAEQAQAIAAGEEEPDEPLAKLGVAPGAEQAAKRADERAAEKATGKNQ